MVAVPVYHQVPFSWHQARFCYCLCFWWWSFLQAWHDISLWCKFTFPQWLVMFSIFSYTCCFLYIFIRVMFIQIFCHFLIGLFLWQWIVWVLYIFLILTPYQIYVLQYFSHSASCLFLYWWFMFLYRSFFFDVVHFWYFFPSILHVLFKKSIPRPMLRSFAVIFFFSMCFMVSGLTFKSFKCLWMVYEFYVS